MKGTIRVSPGRIILFSIVLMFIFISAGAEDRLLIDHNRNPRLLPYDAEPTYTVDYGATRKSILCPVQIFESADSDTGRPVAILAYNKKLDDDAPASFALYDCSRNIFLDEDPVYVTIKDYCLYYDTRIGQKCIAAGCYRNDSAFVIRHIPGTDKYDYLFLAAGTDHTGNGEWETVIYHIATVDYDYDGRGEVFFYVGPGRDLKPRVLYCVEMEELTIEWSLPVASFMGKGNLVRGGDTLNPAVIFTTYGPQNGVTDSNFDDHYGYLAKVDRNGRIIFNYVILSDYIGTRLLSLDSGDSLFCFYHMFPLIHSDDTANLPDPMGMFSIIDKTGKKIRSVGSADILRDSWLGAYNQRDRMDIYTVWDKGTVRVYDSGLNLLAGSNPTSLGAFLGSIKIPGLRSPVFVIGAGGSVDLYSSKLKRLCSLGRSAQYFQPVRFDAEGNVTQFVAGGENQAGLFRLERKKILTYIGVFFWEYQDLILIVLSILLAGLIVVNYFRRRALAELHRSREQFQAIFETAQDSIFIKDSSLKYIRVNPAMETLFGVSDSALIGKTDRELFGEEAAKEVARDDNRVLKGEVLETEHTKPVKGVNHIFHVVKVPMRNDNGDIIGLCGIARDVTERKQTEIAIRESEEKYRALVEGAGEAIFTANYDGLFLFMNGVAAGRLGGVPDNFCGKTMWDLFPKEYADRQMEAIRNVMKSGRGIVSESTTILQGKSVWYTTSIQPMHNLAGEIVSVLCIASDITALHQVTQELRQERDFSRSILDTANSLIICLDGQARITVFNEECERVTGYCREEVIGKNWPRTFLPPECYHEGLDNFAEWVKLHPASPNSEGRIITKSGEIRTILWSNSSFFGPHPGELTAIAIGQDITERKEAEKALYESEEKLRAMFDSAADGIIVTDLKLNIVQINQACVKLLGAEGKAELIGRSALEFVHPSELERIKTALETAFQKGSTFNVEYTAVGTDGREFSVRVSPAMLHDNRGRMTGFTAIIEDTTERRRLEFRDRARLKLLIDLRSAADVDKCLEVGCNAIYESQLFRRSVLTLHNDEREIINLGQYGLDPLIIEQARRAPAPSMELAKKLTQDEFRVSHSYFIPVESGMISPDIGRAIPQNQDAGNGRSSWRAGDELFVPILDARGGYEGWLSVDTPFDGNRPALDNIVYMEEILDIVVKKVHEIQSLEKLTQERQALAEINAALQESEERFRSLVNNAQDVIFTVSPDGLFTGFNPALEKATGWLESDLLGRSVIDLIHPDDLSQADEHIGRILGGESPAPHEYRVIRKSGDYLVGEFISTPLIRDGKVISILGIARDITERRRMEKELRESEEKFRNLAEHSLQGILVIQDDRHIFVNSRFVQIMESTVEELMALSVKDFIGNMVHPDYREEVTERQKKGAIERKYADRFEMKIITGKGRERWVEVFAQGMVFNSRPAGQIVLLDITERKQAEINVAYRLSFEELIAGISTSFINLSPEEIDGGINEALQRIGEFASVDACFVLSLVHDRREIDTTHLWITPELGRPFRARQNMPYGLYLWAIQKLKRFESINISRVVELPKEAQAEKEKLLSFGIQSIIGVPMITGRNLIGSLGLISIRKEQVWSDEAVALLRIVGEIFVSALERKRAEMEIQKINQEKYRQAKQIAGGFAHEIRNALFPARGALSRLRKPVSDGTEDSAQRENYNEIADEAVTRAIDLTGLITQYTKLDSERMPEKVNLRQVLEEIVDANQIRIGDEKVVVQSSCPSDLWVESNRRQLFIALNNLFLNSLDALTGRSNPTILIEGKVENGLINFSLADNGSGIAAEDINRIFDAFFSTKPDKGTGIGLSIARKIIEMYGGVIGVSSEAGRGTRFEIKMRLFDDGHGDDTTNSM